LSLKANIFIPKFDKKEPLTNSVTAECKEPINDFEILINDENNRGCDSIVRPLESGLLEDVNYNDKNLEEISVGNPLLSLYRSEYQVGFFFLMYILFLFLNCRIQRLI
jgi:hypothetical protein